MIVIITYLLKNGNNVAFLCNIILLIILILTTLKTTLTNFIRIFSSNQWKMSNELNVIYFLTTSEDNFLMF